MNLQTNVIYCGDNLEVLPKYIPDESVDLVYIDPPFNSSRNYEVLWGEAQERRAFQDRFGDVTTYMDWMRPRIREIHRVLKPTGSFWYHCDGHSSHYIKVELDRIFGFDNFRNEITWVRSLPHNDPNRFGRSRDSIFWYSVSDKATFNHQYRPQKEASVKSHYRPDAKGRMFRLASLLAPGGRGPRYMYKGFERNWRFTLENMQELEAQGLIAYNPNEPDNLPSRILYFDESKGAVVQDHWGDIGPLNAMAKERLGYPTQKPLALLERIVLATSNPGSVILDAFCGCGTTLEAAAKHKRTWIGIDFSPTACRVMAQRLEDRLGLHEGSDFILRDMPKTAEQLHQMPHFEFENWAVVAIGGIPNKVKVGDFGIDGRLYLADIEKSHRGDFMEVLDRWYPIQVKQIDKVGRPDIDKFETAMRRDKRTKGYFVAFGFSEDAIKEIKRANRDDGLDIIPMTVAEILQYERVATP